MLLDRNTFYSLEQSGQCLRGHHIPLPVQNQVDSLKSSRKSHWSLQNGLQKCPKTQLSQAIAPFLGGFFFGHSRAERIKNELKDKNQKDIRFLSL